MPISADFLVVFVLFEILELFEYLVSKYSIFEVKLFVLESETLAPSYGRSDAKLYEIRFSLTTPHDDWL